MDLVKLRKAVKIKNINWYKHSLERMMEREIYRENVTEVILKGEVIEDYSEDKPYPSALILGWINKKPLHVVVAWDAEKENCNIITAYYPDLKHFRNDYKTRKK